MVVQVAFFLPVARPIDVALRKPEWFSSLLKQSMSFLSLKVNFLKSCPCLHQVFFDR